MKKLFLLLNLAGCGAAPPATQRVEIPVFTPCATAVPARPDFQFGKLSLEASEGEKVLALARDWPLGRDYEAELEVALAGCL
ncbi:hypothetical protein HSX11_01770 [Oxalobacteraceae bacterium]|nr:hypothetical protein [Oxalobacteraceae bacterium]